MSERLPAVLFASVSTPDQVKRKGRDKISIDYQLAKGKEWCDKNGYYVDEVLRIDGHSRSDPDIVEMMEDSEAVGLEAYDRLRELWKEKAFKVLVAYSADRLGRSGTLIHWVMECTIIKYGLQICLTNDGGLIDRSMIRDKAIRGTAAATQPMDSFRDKTREAKQELIAQGLPTNGRVPLSHVVVRDKSGDIVDVRLDEEMRPFFQHLKDLMLEGVPYQWLGMELYRRYGYLNPSGQPYSGSVLNSLLHNARVWGNNWEWPVNLKRQPRVGAWAYDQSVAPPDDVKLYWGVWPSMYTGEDAEQLKAELRRRSDIQGRSGPLTTHRFSRICVCGTCGGYASVSSSNGRRIGMRCSKSSLYTEDGGRVCPQKYLTRMDEIESFLSLYIAQLLQRRDQVVAERQDREEDMAAAQKTIKRLEGQIDRLIREQSLAPEGLQERYRDQLIALDKQMQSAIQEKETLERAAVQSQRLASRQSKALDAFEDVALETFWTWPDVKINQYLRDLLGHLKVVIYNRKATGLLFKA